MLGMGRIANVRFYHCQRWLADRDALFPSDLFVGKCRGEFASPLEPRLRQCHVPLKSLFLVDTVLVRLLQHRNLLLDTRQQLLLLPQVPHHLFQIRLSRIQPATVQHTPSWLLFNRAFMVIITLFLSNYLKCYLMTTVVPTTSELGKGWWVGWCLMALSAQKCYIVPCE